MNKKQEIQEIFTNWQYLVPGLKYSPEKYYKTLEGKIEAKNIEGVKLSRVTLKQGGMLSRKREYLRVQYGELLFDICGAPFGKNDFFFSYWMGVRHMHGCLALILPVLLAIPLLGAIIEKNLHPLTYFQHDTAAMFNTTIRDLVLEEVDEIIGEANIDPIPESAKAPNDKKLNMI